MRFALIALCVLLFAEASHYEKTLATGRFHACIIKEDRTLYCFYAWGTESNPNIPVMRDYPRDGKQYFYVSSNYENTCAIEEDTNALDCWGANFSNDAPTGQFLQVESGAHHACGLKIDLSITCWGNTAAYNLGNWPQTGSFVYISSGHLHMCVLRAPDSSQNTNLHCWGYDDYDQIKDTPTEGTFSLVNCGSYHNCAIREDDKSIVCWGRDNHGQLTNAPEGGQWSELSSGYGHTCALDANTRLITCWGDVYDTVQNPAVPMLQIMAGMADTCAMDASNNYQLICWGPSCGGDGTCTGTLPADITDGSTTMQFPTDPIQFSNSVERRVLQSLRENWNVWPTVENEFIQNRKQ